MNILKAAIAFLRHAGDFVGDGGRRIEFQSTMASRS